MKTILIFLFTITVAHSQIVIAPNVYSSPTAGGGFVPSDLNPTLYLTYESGITTSGTGQFRRVTSWTDGTYEFTQSDTSHTAVFRDSCLYFPVISGGTFLLLAHDGEFDIMESQDFSVDAWVWLPATNSYSRFLTKNSANPGWRISFENNDNSQPAIHLYGAGGTPEARCRPEGLDWHGEWHHYVWTANRDAYGTIWVDGDSIYASKDPVFLTEWLAMTTTDLRNASNIYIGYNVAETFGYVSVIRFYNNHVLTGAEIDDLYGYGRH